MSLAVIDRLETDIMKGFWAVPKRGMEVGGVLLGRVESGDVTSVFIDDYETVSCEHRRGPSYVLSEPDRKRLEKVLRRATGAKQAVGFFRSHTRLGLYLDQDDMAVIDSNFGSPSQVFLLVRPDATKPGVAGFFFREDGEMHRQSTYVEFPFSSAEILKQRGVAEDYPPTVPVIRQAPASPIQATPEPVASPPAALSPPPKRPVPVPDFLPAAPARTRPFKWKVAGSIAAGILAVGLLEYKLLENPRPPAAVQAEFSPALSVQPKGSFLQVSWDRKAPAVLKAERGVLSITDGGFRRDLNLDARQLRTGAVVYAPRGNEVDFRLDLVDGRTTVSESLRFVSAVQTAAVSREKPEPLPPNSDPEVKPKVKRRVFFDDGL